MPYTSAVDIGLRRCVCETVREENTTEYKMSILSSLVKRAIILAIASFYGVLATFQLIVEVVQLGPSKAFGRKKRCKPPACLEDPTLGCHGYAHLENIRMHYVSNGADDKPLMLLVHGFPEFWYSWRHQLREFKDRYRVVAVDLRGYGDSDKPKGVGNYTIPKLAGDLKELVTALGHSKCVLVAHDWGGIVAWYLAEKFPDIVSHLIINNSPHPRVMSKFLQSSFNQFKLSWYIFLYQIPLLPEIILQFNDFSFLDEIFLDEAVGVTSGHTTPEDVEAYKYNFSRNGFTEPVNYYRALMSVTSLTAQGRASSENQGIQMPTLIIWGENDMALDKALAELSSKKCKSKVCIKYIEGASHWVQMDRPDLVNKYIWEFLGEN